MLTNPDNRNKYKKIHVMGVGGTAMAAIAGLFSESGLEVRGSDAARPYPPMSTALDTLGIEVMHPYGPENLAWGPDLVVVGNVIRRSNPEATALLKSSIPYLSMPQALSRFFLGGRTSLVVAGTHGKTTVSSLLAHLLNAQGMDPSFLIGGIPLDFNSNYRLGSGAYFVVEGDEYDTAFFDKGPKFLHYGPSAAIINNIEFDHADIFEDLDHVIRTFGRLASIMPAGAPLLVPEKDANCRRAVAGTAAKVVTFGLESGDWHAADRGLSKGRALFSLVHGNDPVGEFESPLPGNHNIVNTVAALALLNEVNAAIPALLPGALAGFKGIRKRQEVKGIAGSVTVIDDFAHHPTAVRETIRAIRSAYPGSRVIALFEPESNTSRRAVFQADYVTAFAQADMVFFTTPLEKPDNLAQNERIDMNRLCEDIRRRGVPATMIRDVDSLALTAAGKARPGDVILAMSGRDFKGVHARILKALANGRLDTASNET
ncbi:MAG: UDP-N-acetylmuramate:L-alanyl-gamma-D-glutamyl-meso-diaminopimelate ligase [Deltaproteobacteria bacterium]|nr:UDP-N-acetylmuramate:L-alanyl-gamma-D-glutamyl-meso-diaminopimelate ligase [Deltaproteobacteria bacterium]